MLRGDNYYKEREKAPTTEGKSNKGVEGLTSLNDSPEPFALSLDLLTPSLTQPVKFPG